MLRNQPALQGPLPAVLSVRLPPSARSWPAVPLLFKTVIENLTSKSIMNR